MKKILLLSLLLLLPPLMYAQSAKFPIVSGFGGIYEIPDAVYPDAEMEYSIVIDLKSPQPDKSEINAGLNNVARMMNLHVLGGVAPEKLQVKVLIHGEATYLITNDEAYKERFGTINPNTPLISALVNAGAELYVCGQSLIARSFAKEEINEDIGVGLSMLTMYTTYVQNGYVPLVFN